MRARKKKWAEGELGANPYIVHDAKEHQGNWQAFFGNNNPIHVEIGCGMGRFITQTSLANPDVNYIALEREKQVIVSGARKIREAAETGLANKNIAFIVGDAANLADYFAPGEINRIYINFCDPWPRKKKWAKRRLTHRNFLEMYRTAFNGSGEIFLKTDNVSLFEFSLNEFSENGWRLRNITLNLHESDFQGNIMTEYEKKFSEKGMPIYRLEASIPMDFHSHP